MFRFLRNFTARSALPALAVAACGFLAAPASFAQGYTLVEPGKLTIVNGGNYPPMEYMENGKLVGYDVELGTEVARRMGLEANFVVVEYRGTMGALKSKRGDILLSAVTISPERMQQVLFTTPYIASPIGAAVLKKDAALMPEAVKPDAVYGVEIGSGALIWAKDNVKNGQMKVYDRLQQAIADLRAGRIEFVLNNIPALRYMTKDMPEITMTPAWDKRDAAIAVRLEDKALADKINAVLEDMRKDGFRERLDIKWFGAKK